jgi:tetratricopeptide (TPR) repeat protein
LRLQFFDTGVKKTRDKILSDSTPKSEKTSQALKRRADRLFQRGNDALTVANLSSSRIFFEKALKDYSLVSDADGSAACLLKLGRVLELLGEYDRAQETYQQSRDLYVRLNDNSGIARSQAFLGNVAWAKGNYTNAAKLMEEALSHFKGTGDLAGQAWVTDLMGNLELAKGVHQEAEKYHRAAFAMALDLGESPEGQAWYDYHLAAVELFRGHWDAARSGFLSALGIFTSLGDVLGEVAVYTHLGEIACDQKDYRAAEEYILKSIRLVLPTKCKPLLTDALTSLARLLMGRGEKSKAMGILMIVLSHPTCRQQTKDRMLSLAKALEANFSSQENERGFTWAKQFTIEEIASAWLKTLSTKKEPGASQVDRKPKPKTGPKKKKRRT